MNQLKKLEKKHPFIAHLIFGSIEAFASWGTHKLIQKIEKKIDNKRRRCGFQ